MTDVSSYQVAVHFVKTTSKRLYDKGSGGENANVPPPSGFTCAFLETAGFPFSVVSCFTMWEMSFVWQLFIKPAPLPSLFSPASFQHSRQRWKQREEKKKSTPLLITKSATKREGEEERPFENDDVRLFRSCDGCVLFGPNWNSRLSC